MQWSQQKRFHFPRENFALLVVAQENGKYILLDRYVYYRPFLPNTNSEHWEEGPKKSTGLPSRGRQPMSYENWLAFFRQLIGDKFYFRFQNLLPPITLLARYNWKQSQKFLPARSREPHQRN